jgi:SAM-dependent methyltransferase
MRVTPGQSGKSCAVSLKNHPPDERRLQSEVIEDRMYIISRSWQFVEAALKAYGPSGIKRYFWNREYSGTKWDFADNTAGDCVYGHLERFGRNGRILDLGCGSGNTANEVAELAYSSYTGVDISEEALAKARARCKRTGRDGKTQFACSDFMSYHPSGEFDVILFRESMYHVPIAKIPEVLDKYGPYLKEDGVFVVRLFAGDRQTSKMKHRPVAMLQVIEDGYDIIEKRQYPEAGSPTVLVFRPKPAAAAAGSAGARQRASA